MIRSKYKIHTKHITLNQEGTASIVSTFIIVILLSLISIGFAKIMSRSLQESLNSHLSSAANYAAQSGINDTIAYIKAKGTPTNTACSGLKGTPPEGINFDISADTKYTCILTSPTSIDLIYQNVNAYTSKIVDISGSSKIMISWEGSGNNPNNLPTSSTKLRDETYWGSQGYVPVLRLTLYPMGNNLNGIEGDARTYFLYPTNPTNGGTTNIVNYISSPNGSIQFIKCKDSGQDQGSYGDFNGSRDAKCNAVIELPSATMIYARLTPLYNNVDIKIKGNDSSKKPIHFADQTTIDVTAQSGGATKRLQARIDNRTQVEIPEYALRTTNLLCKRITLEPDPYGLDMDLGGGVNATTDCVAPSGYGTGG